MVRSSMDQSNHALVFGFLQSRIGASFCGACIALAVKLSLQDARAALVEPLQEMGFRTHAGQCSSCGRSTTVSAAA
jgi:hypothetical protein